MGEIWINKMDSTTNFAYDGSLNTAICPLCGEANHCIMAVDPNATMCWCEGVVFPEELLALIPENAFRKTCVCQKCLEQYQDSLKT